MIIWHNEETRAIHWQNKAIIAVYAGLKQVWILALSCFGRGFWMNELGWNNTDAWKNEP